MTGTNRSRCALTLLIGHILFLGLLATTARSDSHERPVQDSQPVFPVVVRISTDELNSRLSRNVEHSGVVDSVIVGTRARGTSYTNGKLSFRLVENHNDDFLVVQFRGQTHTQSRGRTGPAVIDSHSDTQFNCTRRIQFDSEKGFVAGPTQVRSQTTLNYDSVRAARNGLGSRLISRIAQRRAMDSHEQARREIARDQRAKLIHEFDSRVNEQLASLNRNMEMIRLASSLFGAPGRSQFAANVTPDGLQLGLGVPLDQRAHRELPPPAMDQAPIEVWIHGSLFGNQVSSFGPLVNEQSAWNTVTSLFQRTLTAASPATNDVWFRVATGNSSSNIPRAASTADSDNYVFVSNLLDGWPRELRSAAPQVASSSANEAFGLSWLVRMLVVGR